MEDISEQTPKVNNRLGNREKGNKSELQNDILPQLNYFQWRLHPQTQFHLLF